MNFLIADSFQASLTRLSNQEQKQVKQTAFDLQMDASAPGLSFHKLDRARDANFWSVRVNRDIRIIVHRTPGSLLLCHVAHHDDAYAWAERRRIETHPRTGAAQIVEVRERVEEVHAAKRHDVHAWPPEQATTGPLLFKRLDDEALLSAGVPPDWIGEVRTADEDDFLALSEHLPGEAAEALLHYAATGALPTPAEPAPADADPFAHPDAQRRFRVLDNVDELRRALDYPWERWTLFLHPAQRSFVDRRYSGPARVSGSAGTGKTVVALHRAVHLARRNPDARILLTTFSKGLANALETKLDRLASGDGDLRARISTGPIRRIGYELYSPRHGQPQLASPAQIRAAMKRTMEEMATEAFSVGFLAAEWNDVVDAWSLRDWESYRDVPRLGRRTRLGPRHREEVWAIMERVRVDLHARGLMTWADVFDALTQDLRANSARPHDFAVVDEAQDIAVSELRFLAALCGERPDGLFFAGDIGQRIFQQPFSWKALGVDIRGRAATLRVNYRTSHQIRRRADRLLPHAVRDVDGNEDDRRGTVSVFNGPQPVVDLFEDEADEIAAVASWIETRLAAGAAAEEIGVFVRSPAQLSRARKAVRSAGVDAIELDEKIAPQAGLVAIATMHWAKGLEFRAVAVMACDDEVIPLQERIETVSDEADLDEVYRTERHLLYVACTRARDDLLVTGVEPASEFLDDIG